MAPMSAEDKFLISGATGRQGGAVARALLARGMRVRALTRRPRSAAAAALARAGAELVRGDFGDADSLRQALQGARGAYSVQNYDVVGLTEEVRQGAAFADAVARSAVPHLVYSSVDGAGSAPDIAEFAAKAQVEAHIRALGLRATILRPVFFMENWLTLAEAIRGGTLALPLRPQTQVQQIAVHDIGVFAALAFADPAVWRNRTWPLATVECSVEEVAAVCARVLGRPVRYVQVGWDAFERVAGSEHARLFRWLEEEGHHAPIAALTALHPHALDLESFLRAAWS